MINVPSKKVIAGVIISTIVVFSVVALIPVFVYGANVEVLQLKVGLPLAGDENVQTAAADSSGEYSFSITDTDCFITAQKTIINPYAYISAKFQGLCSYTETESIFPVGVDISINADITTPGGQNYNLKFSLNGLTGEGFKTVLLILGPDEINIVDGIYHVELDINAVISAGNVEICTIIVDLVADVEVITQ